MDTGTLIDMFRAERDSCLLGTDAVRDGVDVPGDSLRLIVLERIPWGTPTILERARREGAARGLAYVRSVEEALEVYFLSRLPPPMAEALEQDIKELKLSRENYFYSLLDARYRELIAREARQGGPKGAGRKR